MKTASLLKDLTYNSNKPQINLLLESDFTKEIRIVFKENQLMKKHQTPFPIVVEIVEGIIHFGVKGEVLRLVQGDIIALEGGVPHDLRADIKSIVRLTLSKQDKKERVVSVIR